jgi:hypothetical protein
MSEPTVIDARGGLTEVAIDKLQRAGRVQLGLKDSKTAILGLWESQEESEPLVALLVHGAPFAAGFEQKEPLDMLGPASGGLWGRVASALRPGDQLTWLDRDRGTVLLRIDAPNHVFSSTYELSLSAVRWRASQSK